MRKSLGRRGFLAVAGGIATVSGLSTELDGRGTGYVEATWTGEIEDTAISPEYVDSSYPWIRNVEPVQEALRRADDSRERGETATARVDIDDVELYAAVTTAFENLPEYCTAEHLRGAYVRYRDEVYVVRVDDGTVV